MSHTQQLIIVGAGGAGSEAKWVAQRMGGPSPGVAWKLIGFADDNPSLAGGEFEGFPLLGTVAQVLKRADLGECVYHCAIGRNGQRERVAELFQQRKWRAATLIDPSAIVAENAFIGEGCYIGPYSVVAPHARLGRHVLVNSHVGVGHHATVGDYAQLCPGVRVNGGCRIDRGVFLGSNATVHPGLSIGEGASIGANSFVIRSVKPRFSMLGVPARIMSRPAENGPDAQA